MAQVAPSSNLRADCGTETFREIVKLGATLSPAGGLHLGAFALFGAFVGGEVALE
jgi:hypothetical protein